MTDRHFTPWGKFDVPGTRDAAPAANATIALTPRVAALLAIAAAHDRLSPEAFIAQAVCRRVEEIGISAAVDWMEASS